MTSWSRNLILTGLCFMAGLLSMGPVQSAPSGPLPEVSVGQTPTPPTIDGVLAPGEWDHAAAVTGFVKAFEGRLALYQSVAWMTYDSRFIYIAFQNRRAPQLELLSKKGRRPDDDNIVFDPSNEVWLTPPGQPATTYQSLFNSFPAVLDSRQIPSLGYSAKSWSGHWQVAATESREYWTVEAKAPIGSFGVPIQAGSTWRGLLTTDVLGDPDGFRAWAPGLGFSDVTRHGTFHFLPDAMAFQLLDISTVFSGRVHFPMAVSAPVRTGAEVEVELRFGAGPTAATPDLVVRKSLNLAAGQRQEFALDADLTTLPLPLGKARGQAGSAQVPSGYCEVSARRGGQILYHQIFPFQVTGKIPQSPAAIRDTPYQTPLGLTANYAPLSKKLIVTVDRLYLPGRVRAVRGEAQLKELATGRVVSQRALAPFRLDYSSFAMDLGALKVPIQTEASWRESKLLASQSTANAAPGSAPPGSASPAGGPPALPPNYTLQVVLQDAAGAVVARGESAVTLQGYQFDWLPNTLGISDTIIKPWTPLAFKDGVLSLWNKRYRLNGLGLGESIVNGGERLLDSMKMEAVLDGARIAVPPGSLKLVHLNEAKAQFAGTSQIEGLRLETRTRVEFDGFVWNEMKLVPLAPIRLDRLSLLVTMPEAQAPYFVTTAGGWSSYFGATPAAWDSRETSTGTIRGNFVPYVFLTDSSRGFCWFADNEKGWLLDPKLPTQQLQRGAGKVTFRVDFVNRGTVLSAPVTIAYGWSTTPQKPQPPHWRATTLAAVRTHARATTLFWTDADWAVLWPYYASPFPLSYDKSKLALDDAKARGIVPAVGNIAHAIARYKEQSGRSFEPLAADWGMEPGNLNDGDVARSRGPNDFQLWNWNQWIEKSGLTALYFDENYLAEDLNYLTGGAYLRSDESVQPGYSYLGLREMDKRLRYLFAAHHIAAPNLWLHTTAGQAVYAWMPDVAMEGENVEPTGGENDYLHALPSSRLRSIGMGRNLGAAPLIMCQAQRHASPVAGQFLTEQFVGWVLAHDCLPEGVEFWHQLMPEMQMWRDDIRFLPYWEKGWGAHSLNPAVLVSAHAAKSFATLWLVNTTWQAQHAQVQLDLKKLGVDAKVMPRIFDAETGEPCALHGDILAVPLPARMWRAVRIVAPAQLKSDETFSAHFDGAKIVADEAMGDPYPAGIEELATVEGGKSGRAAPMDRALAFGARQHLWPEHGTLSFAIRTAGASGTVLALPGLRLEIRSDAMWLTAVSSTGEPALLGMVPFPADATGSWHNLHLSWLGARLTLTLDGGPDLTVTLPAPLNFPMERGMRMVSARYNKAGAPRVIMGPLPGARLDDLVMGN